MMLKLSNEDMSVIDKVADKLKINTHLDSVVSAVIEYLYQEDRAFINAEKQKIKEKQYKASKRHKVYELTSEDKALLKFDTSKTLFYRIEMKEIQGWEKGKGNVKMCAYGANIWYSSSSDISHLAKHIIIAHELGHIVLHTKRSKSFNRYMPEPTTDKMELEATYFAKIILLKLSNKMKEYSFMNDITVSIDDIRDTIKIIQKGLRVDSEILKQ